MVRVAIVGPEASGKSFLTKQLAEHFNTSYAEEFAREYLLNKGLNYRKNDLIKIAKGQIAAEKRAERDATKIAFFDTNLLVIKIWSEFKYQSCDSKILEWHRQTTYDLHLLLRPDLVYQEDSLRENPDLEEREELFKIYKNQLSEQNRKFAIVEGSGEERLKNALKFLQSQFSL